MSAVLDEQEYSLDVDDIINRTNKELIANLHIRKDDPIMAFVRLNEILMKTHVAQVARFMRNGGQEISITLQQEKAAITETYSELLQSALNESVANIREQAALGLQDWEANFHKKLNTTLNAVQVAVYLLILVSILGSIWFSIQIGGWLGDQLSPKPSPSHTHSSRLQHP